MESYPSLDRPERQILGDIVLNGVSLDALVAELGTSRNGIYKMLFGVRRKLRAELVANRYLDNDNTTEALVNESTVLDRFLHTGPHDVRYEKAMGLPYLYVDLVSTDIAAAERHPGVAAHLGCLRAMREGLRRAALRGGRFGQLVAAQWTASPREGMRDG